MDLISRDAAKAAIKNYFIQQIESSRKSVDVVDANSEIQDKIDALHTVDAAVVHARWELFSHTVTDNGVKSWQHDFRCSHCHKAVFHNGEMRGVYDRCYKCGAIMDEEE